jgi:acetylornithine deacetylase/succinyl-diaminopimelate desuccinylase-like protein
MTEENEPFDAESAAPLSTPSELPAQPEAPPPPPPPPAQPALDPLPPPDMLRKQDRIAVAVLCLAATIFFADVLFGFNNFFIRDLTRYYYPTKQIQRSIVLGGEFPYWNRNFSGGQPIAANPEHEVSYPLTWLILLPNYDLGYRLHILIHIYIGLLGMYALLRSMKLLPFAAFYGALIFGLGGIYLSYINLLPILFCAAWLPLTCLYVRRFLLEKRVFDFAMAALFLGMQFLVGEPTTVMQTGFLIGMYALYRGWHDGSGALGRIGQMAKSVGWIAVLSTIAFAVGAAQMIPAIDHVGDSARSLPFEFKLVSAWSMPWAKMAEVIYPNLLGHISVKRVMWYWASGLYPGMGSPFIFNIYSGLLLMALVIGGLFVRPRGGRLVLILVVFSLLLALGGHTPLLQWLYGLGIATSIRYPEKFVLIAMFALILFGAQMFDRILRGDDRVRDGALGFLVATTMVAVAVAIAGFTPLYGQTFMKLWGLSGGGGKKMVALSHNTWIIAAVRGIVFCALLWFARTPRRALWSALLAIAVLADLWMLQEINPREPQRFFTEPPPIAKTFPENRKDFRVFHEADWYGSDEIAQKYFSSGDAVYWMVRGGLFPMTPAGQGLQTVLERDYDKTALIPSIELVDSLWDVKRSGRKDWWRPFTAMSNAWYRGTFKPYEAEKKRVKGDLKKLEAINFQELEHHPRYYFADQMVTIKDRKDFARKLSYEKHSDRVAFVRMRSFQPAAGEIRDVRETANTARIELRANGRAFLVMSVTPHKYWEVAIDGKPVTPIVTNIGYQGIVVPAGNHVVTMRYRNKLVQLGLAISGTTILLLVLTAAGARRRETAPGRAAISDAKRRRHRNERIAATILVLAVGGAVWGFIAWNRKDAEEFEKEQPYVPKEMQVTPEALMLRDYVRIDTSRQNELEGARWLAAELAKRGVRAEIIESAPGRGNVYARIRGRNRGNALLLLQHIDVIDAPPQEWWDPPFEGVMKINMLFGRGTLDMKGIGICHLLAFADAARGATPEHDIVFLAVADEEKGGVHGMQWLLANRPDIFEGVTDALNEGGVTEMLRDKPTYFGIEVGGKTLTSVTLGGSKEALHRARIALEPHTSSNRPERVLPEVNRFFQQIAPHRILFAEHLAGIEATIARGDFWRLPSGYRELTQNVVFPRGVRTDERGASMGVLLYNLPDEDPDRRLGWLTKTITPFGATVIDVDRKDAATPITSDDTPLFRLLRREVQAAHSGVDVGPYLLNNSTNDSRFLRQRGIRSYGVSPFLVDVGQSGGIHGPNESIRLDRFMDGIALTRRIVSAYARGEAR